MEMDSSIESWLHVNLESRRNHVRALRDQLLEAEKAVRDLETCLRALKPQQEPGRVTICPDFPETNGHCGDPFGYITGNADVRLDGLVGAIMRHDATSWQS
jgi:hypothetical protein